MEEQLDPCSEHNCGERECQCLDDVFLVIFRKSHSQAMYCWFSGVLLRSHIGLAPEEEGSKRCFTKMWGCRTSLQFERPSLFSQFSSAVLGSLGEQKELLCDSCPVIRKVSRWGEKITPWSLLGDACRLRAQGCNNYCIECVLVFSHHPCLARQLTSPDGRSLILFQSFKSFRLDFL